MKQLGSDVLALACIVGSAGIGAAATLALAESPSHVDAVTATVDCAVEIRQSGPRVVVALAGGHGVVVAPDVEVGEAWTCDHAVDLVEVRARADDARVRARDARERAREGRERAREARERARVEVERARERVIEVRERVEQARVRVQGVEHIDLDDFEFEFELEGVELDESLEIEIEQRLEDAMRQLEDRLERLDDEVGA